MRPNAREKSTSPHRESIRSLRKLDGLLSARCRQIETTSCPPYASSVGSQGTFAVFIVVDFEYIKRVFLASTSSTARVLPTSSKRPIVRCKTASLQGELMRSL